MPPDPPLRLSLLTTFGEQCGIATYSEALVEGLTAHGVEVSIVAPRLPRADSARGAQPKRIWRRSRAGLFEAWRTFRQIQEQRAQVVHVQVTLGIVSPTFLLGLTRLCRNARVPLFATLHEASGGTALRRFHFARALYGLRGAQLIVHEPDASVPGAHVIPHGMADLPRRPREAARRELGIAEDTLVMAHFGFIHPDKGIEEMLRVVAELRAEQFPNLQYRVCGGTFATPDSRRHLSHLQGLAHSLGLGGAVTLTGEFAPESAVTLEMQAADLVVLNYLTGNRQGASGAAHRALATGCALAVTRAPIFDSLRGAAHTLTGPLQGELRALLQSPTARADIAARARDFCDARRWPRVAGQHAELYRSALSRLRAGGSPSSPVRPAGT